MEQLSYNKQAAENMGLVLKAGNSHLVVEAMNVFDSIQKGEG